MDEVNRQAYGYGADLRLFGACLAVFLVVDFARLVFRSPRFYEPQIGRLMAEQVTWAAAIVFSVLCVVALVVLVVMPGPAVRRARPALGKAALPGLASSGADDLTNLATLEGRPLGVADVDMASGARLSTIVALVGLAVGRGLR